MRFTFISISFHFVIFSIVPGTFSKTIQRPPNPQPSNNVITDVTYSGLYKIVNCNANLPARLNPESRQVQDFLTETWKSIRLLLADLPNGTNSKYGFNAFFKSDKSVRTITNKLRGIIYGAGVGLNSSVPILACLEESSPNPFLQALYRQGCRPGKMIASFPNVSYIGLCPGFFVASRRGLDFPVHEECPILDMITNTMKDASYPLMHNTYPLFLAEILKLHVPVGVAEGKEVHHTQDSINLNATTSLANVANWANYAASVEASCVDWPTLPGPRESAVDEEKPSR